MTFSHSKLVLLLGLEKKMRLVKPFLKETLSVKILFTYQIELIIKLFYIYKAIKYSNY